MSNLEEQLAALRQEYLEELPATAARLSAATARLPSLDQQELESLCTEVHKLAGNAAAFGYIDIGRQAMELDQRYSEIIEQRAFDELPATAEKLTALIAKLEALAQT